VAVDDVEGDRLTAGQLDGGPREEDEPLGIVGEVAAVAVQPVA